MHGGTIPMPNVSRPPIHVASGGRLGSRRDNNTEMRTSQGRAGNTEWSLMNKKYIVGVVEANTIDAEAVHGALALAAVTEVIAAEKGLGQTRIGTVTEIRNVTETGTQTVEIGVGAGNAIRSGITTGPGETRDKGIQEIQGIPGIQENADMKTLDEGNYVRTILVSARWLHPPQISIILDWLHIERYNL